MIRPPLLALQEAVPAIVPADTAWMLMATALVLLMTPALAFFYGGLVRSKNSLNTMMMSFVALGAVGITWAVAAYSLAFSEGGPLLGGTTNFFLNGVGLGAQGTIPQVLFLIYQGTFAIITAALISGAVVERMRFGPYVAFISLWTLLVYAPIAHWVWGGGWLMSRGVLDFAGGTVVHINAGVSAIVALAPMATLVVWVLLDYARSGHATAVGAATAIVVGLVAITPAAGFVSPGAALLLGGIAAFPSYFVIVARSRTRLDDSLDVFAGHGVGGITGALLTGVFASKVWNAAGNDGLLAGNPSQLATQALGVAAAIVYSGVATFALLKVLGFVTALRAVPKTEGMGMDVTQHGEEAYTSGEGSILVISEPTPGIAPAPVLNPQTAAR